MKEIFIPNFTLADQLRVCTIDCESTLPIVSINQSSGSLNFQHDMTPKQARLLAIALMDQAAEAECLAAMRVARARELV